MPSEKLKYLETLLQREAVFCRSWSDEEGDRSLAVSRDGGRLFVRIKKEWAGVLEVEISPEDAEELICTMKKVLPLVKYQEPNQPLQRNAGSRPSSDDSSASSTPSSLGPRG